MDHHVIVQDVAMTGSNTFDSRLIEEADGVSGCLTNDIDVKALQPEDAQFGLPGRGNNLVKVSNHIRDKQDLSGQEGVEDSRRKVTVDRKDQCRLVLHPFPEPVGAGLAEVAAPFVRLHQEDICLRHLRFIRRRSSSLRHENR